LTHILLTTLLHSTTLLVIRVLHLMTQVSSTAHMYLSRWYVQLVRTPSSQKSDLRPATAWSLIHSLKAQIKVLVDSRPTPTATTEEYVLTTSCDPFGSHETGGGLRTPFFYSKYLKNHGRR